MTQSLKDAKALLRRRLRAELQALSPSLRQAGSDRICSELLQSPNWRQSKVILAFASMPNEPDVMPLWQSALADHKTLCLPRFDPETDSYLAAIVTDPARDLAPARYGILEPTPQCPITPLNRLDLVLVPGLAFSPGGCRLGRGKGYYDRLLAGLSALKCGIGFDLQWSESIPQETCDVLLDCILTPGRGLVWCRPRL
jgi:5-formyltetrahydrofolate cyclo-ligase